MSLLRELRYLLLVAVAMLLMSAAYSAETDSLAVSDDRKHTYVSLGASYGLVLPTNDFVSGDNKTSYVSKTLKYVYASRGDDWQSVAYGMPYYGVAISKMDYGRKEELGTPVSIYLLQGATIGKIGERLDLNYEFNLGFSTNWKPYDAFTNPDNTAIGSTLNVHVSASSYLKYYLSKAVDIHLGGTVTHFSNGTSRQPNSGINQLGAFVELTYNFNRKSTIERYNPDVIVPEIEPLFEHDFQLIMSSKNVKVDTVGSNLPDIYTDKQFDVYGFNYYLMRATNYKHRYGIGLELEYDGSAGAKIYNKLHPDNGKYYTVTEMADFKDRLSLGVAFRTEAVLPYYSIFLNMGISVLNHDLGTPRLYQVLGVKSGISDDVWATFGIKAVNFSQAQYLYWSLGYTIPSTREAWRQRRKK